MFTPRVKSSIKGKIYKTIIFLISHRLKLCTIFELERRKYSIELKSYYLDIMCIALFIYMLLGVSYTGSVDVTVYHITGLTASGEHTNEIQENFVALSRDLVVHYPFNTHIKLSDCPFEGIYIVKDLMNKRWKKKVDVFLSFTGERYNPCECQIAKYDPDAIPIEDTETSRDSIK